LTGAAAVTSHKRSTTFPLAPPPSNASNCPALHFNRPPTDEEFQRDDLAPQFAALLLPFLGFGREMLNNWRKRYENIDGPLLAVATRGSRCGNDHYLKIPISHPQLLKTP